MIKNRRYLYKIYLLKNNSRLVKLEFQAVEEK